MRLSVFGRLPSRASDAMDGRGWFEWASRGGAAWAAGCRMAASPSLAGRLRFGQRRSSSHSADRSRRSLAHVGSWPSHRGCMRHRGESPANEERTSASPPTRWAGWHGWTEDLRPPDLGAHAVDDVRSIIERLAREGSFQSITYGQHESFNATNLGSARGRLQG